MFTVVWLKNKMFKGWLKQVEGDDISAYCAACNATFDVGNIGIAALTSHIGGAKHKRNFATANSNIPEVLHFG